MRLANEMLAFLLELVAIALLAWWGVHVGGNVFLSLLLGIGLPAVAIVLWGSFAAPKARFKVSLPWVLLVKALVFGGATAAIFGLGYPGWALAFAIVVIANTTIATITRARYGIIGELSRKPD